MPKLVTSAHAHALAKIYKLHTMFTILQIWSNIVQLTFVLTKWLTNVAFFFPRWRLMKSTKNDVGKFLVCEVFLH